MSGLLPCATKMGQGEGDGEAVVGPPPLKKKQRLEPPATRSGAAAATAPAPDPSEVAFQQTEAVLRGAGVEHWSDGQRTLFVEMVSDFLKRCTPSYNKRTAAAACVEDNSRETDALPEAQVPEEVQHSASIRLWNHLATVRSVLGPLVPFGKFKEATKPPFASTLFPPTDAPVFAVDSFLYGDDDDVDALCDAGLIARDYCVHCGGTELAPTRFVSHSFSPDQLVYIFAKLLPHALSLASRTAAVKLVDVGSRLGVVLFAAYYASPLFKPIVGIEINKDFVVVQRTALQRQKIHPRRVTILEMDALSEGGLAELASADVVFLNNVFEWFVPIEQQLDVWHKVMKTLSRPGQVLVTYPSLVESLTPLVGLQQLAKEKRELPTLEKARQALASKAQHAAEALIHAWADQIDCSALVAAHIAENNGECAEEDGCCGDHAHNHQSCDQEDHNAGEADSVAEERGELLSAISCYRVR